MTAATMIVRQPALASSPQPTPTARALIAQCTKRARPRRWGEVHMKTWMPLRASPVSRLANATLRARRSRCEPRWHGIRSGRLFDQLADALDYRLGRGVGFLDQRFEFFTAFGFKRKFALLGFRNEFRVLHGRHEGVAQQLEPIRRQIGRRDERTPDALANVEKLDRLLVGVIMREFDDERHVLQFRIGLRAALEYDRDGLGRDPVRSRPS